MTRLELLRSIVARHQGRKVKVPGGTILVDALTARAMLTVYDGLSEPNRDRFLFLPWDRAVRMTWHLLK